jgi:hypothetical protein
MTRYAAQPSGALVLRAWVEEQSLQGLRVRVIRIQSSGETSTVSAGSVEATCDIVKACLNELLEAGSTTPGSVS